jgi:integrase
MDIIIKGRPSTDGKKIRHHLEWGRHKGQRHATKIFTYAKPANKLEKNHNKEAMQILEAKRSQLILEKQAISSGYIPQHKYKNNFLDYYEEFVTNNKTANNRHLEGSLVHFKKFLKTDYLAPIDITENLCERFRKYLLDKFNGGTPANYFGRFKRVLRTATKEGYFRINPTMDVAAKSNKNYKRKEHLEAFEYVQLLNTPCLNEEVQEAFILCCYTGLRWCDVKPLKWESIQPDAIKFRISQAKTNKVVLITLHPIAKAILDKRRARFKGLEPSGKIFNLPSAEGALKALDKWCKSAGLQKHITWHCARLSFSILLQDANVDAATIALMMGQSTSKYVHDTYKRHRPRDQSMVIGKLPSLEPIAF